MTNVVGQIGRVALIVQLVLIATVRMVIFALSSTQNACTNGSFLVAFYWQCIATGSPVVTVTQTVYKK